MASPYKESQEGVFRLSGPIELDEHNRTTSIFNILGRDEESLKPGSPMALRGLPSRRYARKPTPRELYYSDMPCLTLGPSVGFSNPSTTLNSRSLMAWRALRTRPWTLWLGLGPLLPSARTLRRTSVRNYCLAILTWRCPENEESSPRFILILSSNQFVSDKSCMSSLLTFSHCGFNTDVSVPRTSSTLWPIISEGRVGLPSRREFV